MSKKGEIWSEYWIECSKCEHRQPLAADKAPAKAARKQGWTRVGMVGPWVCPDCSKPIWTAKEPLQQTPGA